MSDTDDDFIADPALLTRVEWWSMRRSPERPVNGTIYARDEDPVGRPVGDTIYQAAELGDVDADS